MTGGRPGGEAPGAAGLLRDPRAVFVLVAFGVPWMGWSSVRLLGLGPSPLRTALLYTGDFCSVAGLVAMYARSGRSGVKALLRRCVEVRAPAVWWMIALLLPFFTASLAFVWVGLRDGGVGAVDPAAFSGLVAPAALLALTTGPLGEELGWRGYLTPTLLESANALVVSLVVGLLWAIWHFPLYLDTVFADWRDASTFTAGIVLTTVVMTAILLHTRGSVLVAVVYHWLSNVATGVVDGVFVDVERARLGLVPLAIEVLVVVGFVVVLGPTLTRRGHDVGYGELGRG